MRAHNKARVFAQDGKQHRKTKEETCEEMLQLKEGREEEAEIKKQQYLKKLKEETFKRATPEEIEKEQKEHEEKRKKLLELYRPKT